ncbi:hypothetical protein [Streptomyces sp. NPDC060366]|uniref:hypothetical protein n=1 Tax=Streptomyces sp. NPDC060366 TaxID=3347105 RepID=UPI003653DFB4
MTSDELHQALAAYDQAVHRAGSTDRSLPEGERWALGVAAPQLASHAPSDRTDPDVRGVPW